MEQEAINADGIEKKAGGRNGFLIPGGTPNKGDEKCVGYRKKDTIWRKSSKRMGSIKQFDKNMSDPPAQEGRVPKARNSWSTRKTKG